jgi:hypothetical protein
LAEGGTHDHCTGQRDGQAPSDLRADPGSLSRIGLILVLVGLAFGCGRRVSVGSRGSVAAVPAGASQFRFEDATAAAGLHFRHTSGAFGRRYMIETMGPGCAVLDFDGDGRPDLFFPNGTSLPAKSGSPQPSPVLYRNEGGGRFTDVTRGSGLDVSFYGMGCAVGDYDNDGRPDLYVTAALGPSRLFHNLGGGQFRDVTAAAGAGNGGDWGAGCAWVDYDRDGDLDLFIANYVRYRSLHDDIPCTTGAGIRTYCLPFAYEPVACRLYRNDDGHFRDVSQEAGIAAHPGKSLGVLVEDIDGDGWPDLFVASDTEPNLLFRNNRDGTFSERAAEMGAAVGESGSPRGGMGVDAADAGNNGFLSLAVTHFAGEAIGLYRQSSRDLFADRAEAAQLAAPTRALVGFGVLFVDVDSDGWDELFVLNGHVYDNVRRFDAAQSYAQRPLLFRNQRDGTYRAVPAGVPFERGLVGRGAACADLDGDGRLDLVVTANHGPAEVWMNRTPVPGHWLTVRLVGNRSNRDGIGAVVRLTANGVTQRRFVSPARGYLSASDARPHFGLGPARRVERLEVVWPSGTRDTWRDLPADRVLTVREGETGP